MKLRSTLLALALTFGSGYAFAGEAAEVQLVRRAIAEVESSATATDERALALLGSYVDIAGFEARVLSDIASSLTPAQQKTLSDALRPLLAHRIALRLASVPALKPRVEAPREENGETRVKLVYKNDDGDLEIDLVFAKRATPAAPIRVVDATIAGAGLSKNLRASVNKVMRRDGFDALVLRLKQLREAKAAGPHKSSDLTL